MAPCSTRRRGALPPPVSARRELVAPPMFVRRPPQQASAQSRSHNYEALPPRIIANHQDVDAERSRNAIGGTMGFVV